MDKKCVLIYDDDVEILNVCKAILQTEDYRVEALSTCENIIADIKKLNPQVILMDIWIPKIGGEAAIKMMHENEATRHIPVIIFSANSNIENIGERVSASGFLRKPFDIRTFRQTIRNHIL
ncbi:MAG TPA: response regulator [Hanamia sp.]|jgi:DNA-binding NtrC family response regulator|nr:response regulator [Hanamia sp.]HZI69332.1 response regulator [Hanamia sp.]